MSIENIRKIKEQANLPKQTPYYQIPKVSAKRAAKIAQEKLDRGDGDTELQKWFKGRIKFLKGKCCNCGGETFIKSYSQAINHIAHILPKRKEYGYSSVATNPHNFLELCQPCHGNYDNLWSWEDKAQLKIWPLILERFIMMEPNLSPEDRKKLPEILLQEIKPSF